MATGNVGNLNVKLTLSAEQFAAALVAAGGDVNQFAMQVEASKKSLNAQGQAAQQTATNVAALTKEIKNYNVAAIGLQNRSDSHRLFQLPRRGTDELIAAAAAQKAALGGTANAASTLGSRLQAIAPVITAASYAAQDAASQFGNRGWGAAMMAAANNIPMLGLPWKGVGVAVASGIAVAVQALGSYIDFQERAAKATRDAKKAADDAFGNRVESITQRVAGDRSFVREIVRIGESGGSATERFRAFVGMNRERAETVGDVNAALRALAPERQGAVEARGRAEAAIWQRAMALYEGNYGRAAQELPKEVEIRDRSIKQLEELDKRERELLATRDTAEREMQRLRREIEQSGRAMRREEFQAQQEAEKKRIEQATKWFNEQGMKAAPGIGAFGADTQQGFSMIQAALRTAKDVKNPQLDTISGNTRKTADNTRDIAKTVKRFKVATIP